MSKEMNDAPKGAKVIRTLDPHRFGAYGDEGRNIHSCDESPGSAADDD